MSITLGQPVSACSIPSHRTWTQGASKTGGQPQIERATGVRRRTVVRVDRENRHERLVFRHIEAYRGSLQASACFVGPQQRDANVLDPGVILLTEGPVAALEVEGDGIDDDQREAVVRQIRG